jgi:hypothetical protein
VLSDCPNYFRFSGRETRLIASVMKKRQTNYKKLRFHREDAGQYRHQCFNFYLIEGRRVKKNKRE